jgi:hypothetical protein
MTPLLTFALGIAASLALIWVIRRFASFAAQRPADYAGIGPVFDLRKHLSGPLRCEGVIYGPTGRVSSRFTADMMGTWDGNRGTLAEHFSYDSGTKQDREWRLSIGNDGRISAEADDLVGTGTGEASGAALRLQYTIKLPESAGGHALDVTDWLYLVDDKTIVNRSQFRKFGVKVAELVATMRRVDA